MFKPELQQKNLRLNKQFANKFFQGFIVVNNNKICCEISNIFENFSNVFSLSKLSY